MSVEVSTKIKILRYENQLSSFLEQNKILKYEAQDFWEKRKEIWDKKAKVYRYRG